MKLTLILVLVICLIQDSKTLPTDFSELKKISIEELQLKTEAHVKIWGLGKIERWDFQQGTGELVFTLPGGFKAVCPAQIIGTYNNEDGSWLWSWANSSIEESLTKDSLKLKKYGQDHKIEMLTKQKWNGKPEDAWAMTAVAVKLLDKQGAYRGPAGNTDVYFVFGEVVVRKQ